MYQRSQKVSMVQFPVSLVKKKKACIWLPITNWISYFKLHLQSNFNVIYFSFSWDFPFLFFFFSFSTIYPQIYVNDSITLWSCLCVLAHCGLFCIPFLAALCAPFPILSNVIINVQDISWLTIPHLPFLHGFKWEFTSHISWAMTLIFLFHY